MKIINKRPVKTADVSSARHSAWGEFWKLVISSVLLIIALFFLTGFAVDLIVTRISIETECKIFRFNNLDNLAKTDNLNEDQGMEMAHKILEKFKSSSDVPPIDYKLVLLKEKRPNAFAMPGGTIGLTSGLLEVLDDEVELAFVIAHELGHFNNRDHLNGLGRAVSFSVIMAILFESGPGAESFGNIMNYTAQRQYSREREEKADQYAIELVYNTYGEIEGTDRLFQILTKDDVIPGWAYMFTTHPSPGTRIKNLEEYSKKIPIYQKDF